MRTVVWYMAIFCLMHAPALSQNLISNPGFEDHAGCPERNGEIKKCISWSSTSPASTPDYFHRCFVKGKFLNTDLGVPYNSEGYRNPASGDAYVGMALFFKRNYTSREYIQNKLQEPLEKGVVYKVSFYMCLSDSSEYFSNHISVAFTSVPNGIKANPTEPLLASHQLVTCRNDSLLRSTSWVKVEMEYTARGGEEYMIVGSFQRNMTEKEYKKVIKKSRLECTNNECAAYYFLDDFFVSLAPSTKVNPKFR